MKKITEDNYKKDGYYKLVVDAVREILDRKDYVTAIEVFVGMGLLSNKDVEEWRYGRISYLERVIKCNLSKANRILRLLSIHAKDMKLTPSTTTYVKWGGKERSDLRFSKTGDANLEAAYCTHYVVLEPYRKHDKTKSQSP